MMHEPQHRRGPGDSRSAPPESVLRKVRPHQLLPLAHANGNQELVNALQIFNSKLMLSLSLSYNNLLIESRYKNTRLRFKKSKTLFREFTRHQHYMRRPFLTVLLDKIGTYKE